MRRATSLSLLVATIWLATSSSALRAAVVDWINPAGGTFSDSANWSGGKAPTAADSAWFENSSVYTVDFTAPASLTGLYVTTDDVALDLDTNTLELVSPFSDLVVGYLPGDEGLLSIKHGLVDKKSFQRASVGYLFGSHGSLTVRDGGSLSSSGYLVVGDGGAGVLSVVEGGKVSSKNGVAFGSDAKAVGTGTVSGTGSFVTSPFLQVGDLGNGELTIRDGGKVETTGSASIGNVGLGSVDVVGKDAVWLVGMVFFGQYGEGKFNVREGGYFNSAVVSVALEAKSEGHVHVTGAGSEMAAGFFNIGEGGTGSVLIDQGAKLRSLDPSLGRKATGNGDLTIRGSETTFVATDSTFLIGDAGRGKFTIDDGATATTVSTTIGGQAGSVGEVYVTDVGTAWKLTGQLIVGNGGSGELTVSGGAQLLSGSATTLPSQIGFSPGSEGEVLLTDAGSLWNLSNTLNIGFLGKGALTVQNGASASTQSAVIGRFQGATGEALVTGANSTWTNSGDLSVGSDPNLAGGNGDLEITDGGLVKVGTTATVWKTGVVHLDAGTLQASSINIAGGSLSGVGTLIGNLTNTGEISPGNSPGTLQVQGDFTQSLAGVLKLEIGATAADLLQVTGNAKLGGTLQLSLLGGFTPADGTTYDLLTARTLNGAFDTLLLPDLGAGRSWQFNYGADRVSITAVPEPSTMVLAALGGAVCAAVARRRRVVITAGKPTMILSATMARAPLQLHK